MRVTSSNRRSRQSGVSLLLATMALIFIVPMLGLMVDVGVIYTVRGRLQASVDGAALAAARSLSLGATTESQAVTAKQNAVNWFYANFPAGNWATGATQMNAGSVQVFDDPANPSLRNVEVTASTVAPTYFMKWFNANSVTVGAVGNASRRDVVIMMILDRSGSMGGTCGTMKSAAKLFTGQFAQGRDRIGLLSFSDNVWQIISPTTNFRSVLGYSNDSGNGSGAIDSITCAGWTNTPTAISLAYNEVYRTNLPGAYNALMFETDGLPNTLTLNWWDSTNSVAGISTSSNCKDKNNKRMQNGGFTTAASLPAWTPGYTMPSGSYLSDVPAGIVGSLSSDDPPNSHFTQLFKYSSATPSSYISSTSAPGCDFTTTHNTQNPADFAWFPARDVWGNELSPAVNPYKQVPTAGGKVTLSSNSWVHYHNGAQNATDNAAYRARTNATLPVSFFVIGLGGNSSYPADYVLLQRMANDPKGDEPTYSACSAAPDCITYGNQPPGTFIFAPSIDELNAAFIKMSSQILRLSR